MMARPRRRVETSKPRGKFGRVLAFAGASRFHSLNGVEDAFSTAQCLEPFDVCLDRIVVEVNAAFELVVRELKFGVEERTPAAPFVHHAEVLVGEELPVVVVGVLTRRSASRSSTPSGSSSTTTMFPPSRGLPPWLVLLSFWPVAASLSSL